jgi:hypothetical protein
VIRLIVRSYRQLGASLGVGGREWWRVERADGTLVKARSKQPLLDGARALIAVGENPETLVTMRHAGSEVDSFEPISLAQAARLTVREDDVVSAKFKKWKALPENASGATGEPILGGSEPSEVSEAVPPEVSLYDVSRAPRREP